MKLTTSSLVALALGVAAEPVVFGTSRLVKRDLATITDVVNKVSTSLTSLDTAAKNFKGDAAELTSASSSLQSTISAGVTTVQGTDAISVNDAVTLQGLVTKLQQTAQTFVTDLADKKKELEAGGFCKQIRDVSESINEPSKKLIEAIVSKVPKEVETIATNLASNFTATLQQNSDNFAEGKCTDATGSKGGESGGGGEGGGEGGKGGGEGGGEGGKGGEKPTPTSAPKSPGPGSGGVMPSGMPMPTSPSEEPPTKPGEEPPTKPGEEPTGPENPRPPVSSSAASATYLPFSGGLAGLIAALLL